MNRNDTVCIYGAGHIGCYVGARLASAGAQVTLIGRTRVLDELSAHGLGFSDYLGQRGEVPAAALHLGTEAQAAAGAALVLVCVKSGATDEVGGLLQGVLAPGTPVLSLQNGVRNAQVLAAQIFRREVIVATDPLHRVEPPSATLALVLLH
jgi:2-dehydropantoate 2-reductase